MQSWPRADWHGSSPFCRSGRRRCRTHEALDKALMTPHDLLQLQLAALQCYVGAFDLDMAMLQEVARLLRKNYPNEVADQADNASVKLDALLDGLC
jgi:hypothetical protein